MAAPKMMEYGQTFWWIGQLMNWQAFANDPKNRYPTETETLAQNLLSFIYNGKGIMNFSTAYLVQKGDEMIAGQREGDWRRSNLACAELAPFIRSDIKPPQCTVKTSQGTLLHRLFTDGKGNYRLLLVAPFSGTTRATIEIPDGFVFERSQCYTVTKESNGALAFYGRDVACDIIQIRQAK